MKALIAPIALIVASCGGSTGSDQFGLIGGNAGAATVESPAGRLTVPTEEPTGGQPTGGISTGGQPTGGISTGGQPTGGQQTGGQQTGGQQTGGQPTGGQQTGGQQTGGQQTGGQQTGGQQTGGISTGGQPTGGQPTGGQPTGGQPTGGQPTGGISTGGISTGGQQTGGISTGGQPTGGQPTGGISTGGQTEVEPPPSCAKGLECGEISCCESVAIPGGNFMMGRGTGADVCPADATCGADEQPEHMVSVSDFRLDAFEVTVGRFREFFWFYPENLPDPGGGEHPDFPGSGWREEWDVDMPSRSAAIASFLCHEEATWNKQENLPINCVSWRLAFAFCAWDGGRLPTEIEWEFAAAGGDENRRHPWGSDPPDPNLARYLSNAPAEVGSFRDGDNRWGISDLSGNVGEWTIDLYDPEWYSACPGCLNLDQGFERVVRGGNWWSGSGDLRSADRWYLPPSGMGGGSGTGFRCARDY